MKAATGKPVEIQTRDTSRSYIARLDAVTIRFNVYRDEFCTRVVGGTREITEEVPDPDALAAVPTVTWTRTEDIVEWQCESVLADDSDVA